MKRMLWGLGWTLAAGTGGLLAHDPAPAARLGNPAATLGRPAPAIVRGQSPEVTSAVGQTVTPKVMPKGAVAESSGPAVPGTLPVPAAAPTTGGPIVTIPPGAGPVSGPVILGPGAPIPGPVVSAPVPTGPIPTGPIVGAPPAGCPVGGCPVPMGTPFDTADTGWYTSAEALLWYVKSYSVPPLVTTGPAFSGATLATPGTVVLTGPTIDTNPRYGGRVTLGYWLCPQWAVEASAFYVRPVHDTFRVDSGQYPALDLARPFFSFNRGLESSEIVGRPGVVSGAVKVDSEGQFFGGELNLRYRMWDDGTGRLDLLAGGRFLYLEERLLIEERVRGLPLAGTAAGVERLLTDDFTTVNRYYGLQVGAAYTYIDGPWTVALTAKLGAGITRQTTEIRGWITPLAGGAPPTLPGGLLALNSNIGNQNNNRFSFVPEVGLNVGYDVTDQLRVFAGYSFLYWTRVARPGGQIDRVLDENRIPDFSPAPAAPGIRPRRTIVSENIWVQGVNVGILWKW